MEYETLVYKLGSLHSLLRDLGRAELFQGEHTIAYTGGDGAQRTLHIYIDGTDLQMSDSPIAPDLPFSLDISAGQD